MKAFNTIEEIKNERGVLRNNPIVYNLLGVLIGELDRLPTRSTPTADDIYKQIVKLYNTAKEMSQYGNEKSAMELEYLQEFIKSQLTEEELRKVIEQYHNEGINNIGVMMRQLNTFYRGQFDGKLANQIIKEIL